MCPLSVFELLFEPQSQFLLVHLLFMAQTLVMELRLLYRGLLERLLLHNLLLLSGLRLLLSLLGLQL